MSLAHQFDSEPGVKRLYSVAVERWSPHQKEWIPLGIETCHAWSMQNAAYIIRQSHPGEHIRVVAAGVTLGFHVNDNHGEDLEV